MRVCRFYDASVFETCIRVLGGMLTAHELSGDAAFLTRCGLVLAQADHELLMLRTVMFLYNASVGQVAHPMLACACGLP